MKKTSIVLLVSILMVVVFSACTSQPTPQPVTGTDRDIILAYSESQTNNLLSGLNANNYTQFSRDFDDAMLNSVNQAAFTTLDTQIIGTYGKYISRETQGVQTLAGLVRVVYQGKFEKDDNIIILVVFHPDGDHKITGLFFTK